VSPVVSWKTKGNRPGSAIATDAENTQAKIVRFIECVLKCLPISSSAAAGQFATALG